MKPILIKTAAALCSTVGLAEEPQGGAGASPFDALDTDKNGSLSMAEAQGHPNVSQRFAVADKDRDGTLTRAEFDAAFTTTKPSQADPSRPRPPQQ